VRSAIAEYRKLRSEPADWGLYDFREATLNIVAAARASYRRALEIDPGNSAATGALAKLEKKGPPPLRAEPPQV